MSLENMQNCQMNGFQDDDLGFIHNAFMIATCGKIQINHLAMNGFKLTTSVVIGT
jgi:hypothetical protein